MAEQGIQPVVQVYPNESVIQIDTGGAGSVGFSNVTKPLSSGIGGTSRFQYIDAFWDNDFFTITTSNASVGLAIVYYRPRIGATFCFLPIALPRMSLALDSENITDYQESIAYALNLYFSKPQTVYYRNDDGTIASQVLPINLSLIHI